MRAVVQILLTELVAPVAEAEVLNRPGELGRGRGERKELPDDIEFLAGLTIDVVTPGLGLDHDLAPGGWRPHPVALTDPHARSSYNRVQMPAGPGRSRRTRRAPCRALG